MVEKITVLIFCPEIPYGDLIKVASFLGSNPFVFSFCMSHNTCFIYNEKLGSYAVSLTDV